DNSQSRSARIPLYDYPSKNENRSPEDSERGVLLRDSRPSTAVESVSSYRWGCPSPFRFQSIALNRRARARGSSRYSVTHLVTAGQADDAKVHARVTKAQDQA